MKRKLKKRKENKRKEKIKKNKKLSRFWPPPPFSRSLSLSLPPYLPSLSFSLSLSSSIALRFLSFSLSPSHPLHLSLLRDNKVVPVFFWGGGEGTIPHLSSSLPIILSSSRTVTDWKCSQVTTNGFGKIDEVAIDYIRVQEMFWRDLYFVSIAQVCSSSVYPPPLILNINEIPQPTLTKTCS